MSLILCPECGTKISDKARICPHCGFMSEDNLRPISEQDTYEIVPTFCYDIEEWKPANGNLSVVAVEDNKSLVQFFGQWKNVERTIPAIADVIQQMAKKENILVAKMDKYVKELIDRGVYRFTIDKQGEILPTIRDSEGIVKQVRLEEMSLSPELANSMNNLATHAAMAQILDEIECVGDAIRGIHIELQNDRIALAESARDKMRFAAKIQDTKLREIAILNAIDAATEAKRVLMRNFSENLRFISDNSEKNDVQLFIEGKKGRDIPQKVSDSFQDLVAITNSVQVECEGYAILGEFESSKESLLQFKHFITENHLDDRDTLLLLNENTPQQKIPIVNEFMMISERITNFDASNMISGQNVLRIAEDTENESKEKE
ncbi:zinc ribbon domain-containing protein [Parablautia sp. Marseille-Q6255]|uniref:zinc ribbon domain-containing protein n=1 Tax=Parablautia sp. Marseille-Q6255 TaxID=3039593 RepID=UPI0024BC1502|nr:zinc ribbon domain-containing protein [Parablautia sp. Marseille-Q6255]